MQNDPELRNLKYVTTGDYIEFDLFDADKWRSFRISGTALHILKEGKKMNQPESFEKNIERIARVALSKNTVDDGFVLLESDDFR